MKIMLGANALFLVGMRNPIEAGVLGVEYLRQGGVGLDPQAWPVKSVELAERSLSQALVAFRRFGLEWFSMRCNLAGLAASLVGEWVGYKAIILEELKDFKEAALALEQHIRRLESRSESVERDRMVAECR